MIIQDNYIWPDNISDIKHISNRTLDMHFFHALLHYFCSVSKALYKRFDEFHTFTDKSTSLALNTHWKLPLAQKSNNSRVKREHRTQVQSYKLFQAISNSLQFRLDSQHRGSHVRGDFWNTHWSVFWRNCVTGSRGSRGHMDTFRASCIRAHALIASMLLGARQKAKTGAGSTEQFRATQTGRVTGALRMIH